MVDYITFFPVADILVKAVYIFDPDPNVFNAKVKTQEEWAIRTLMWLIPFSWALFFIVLLVGGTYRFIRREIKALRNLPPK